RDVDRDDERIDDVERERLEVGDKRIDLAARPFAVELLEALGLFLRKFACGILLFELRILFVLLNGNLVGFGVNLRRLHDHRRGAGVGHVSEVQKELEHLSETSSAEIEIPLFFHPPRRPPAEADDAKKKNEDDCDVEDVEAEEMHGEGEGLPVHAGCVWIVW